MERFETNPSNLNALLKHPEEILNRVEFEKDRIKEMLRNSKLDSEELKRRAFRIKPLIRVIGKNIAPLGTTSEDTDSRLLYIKPFNIHASYTYCFKHQRDTVFDDDGKELPVQIIKEVGRFICYHRYGGYWQFVRPSVDEVLEQIPEEFLQQEVDAFEVCFASASLATVFAPNVNRHVSMVILYKCANGLPEQVKNQSVIIGSNEYLPE